MTTQTPPTCLARVAAAADTWQDAMRLGVGMLVELNVAEERYVQACIDSVTERGPYIVLSPGLALAHSRPEDGATGLGVSLLRLGKPVAFGHPSNDPVDLVVSFATPDDGAHIELLRTLATALGSGLAAELRTAPADELTSILQERLS